MFSDLGLVLHRNGPANDLVDTLGALPGAQRRARRAVPATIKALDASQPRIAQLRPYTPDLLGFLTQLRPGQRVYDGNGHYARVQPAGINLFHYNAGTQRARPDPDRGAVRPTSTTGLQPLPGRPAPSRSRAPTRSSTPAPSTASATPTTPPQGP